MIARCYLEITNICNLNCVFCPKTKRQRRSLSVDEFELLTDKLRGEVRFLYFHLMGEPMLHESLGFFISRAREKGFIPVLTTNGTLLKRGLSALPHKIQISLHSHEGNGFDTPEQYIDNVMHFALDAAKRGTIVVLRLWNQGGFDSNNQHLLDLIAQHIPQPWTERYDGFRLCEGVYLEYDQMFEWPETTHSLCATDEVFCYALRNQIGVLADGTVVPCCLDHEGDIPLGNLFTQSLNEILSSPTARSLYEGFSSHKATQDLCTRCEYAAVTKRFRKK